jgi:DhnA family fructose-bisphosphate aldolase class Ia
MESQTMRLGRLFSNETQRAMIMAFDRGLGGDTRGGGETGPAVVEAVVSAGVDGIILSPGMLANTRHLLAHRGAPAILLRTDFLFLGALQPSGLAGEAEEYRTLLHPAEAAAMGADALVMFLMLGNAQDSITADNIEAVARAAAEAHKVGLPIIVETVLWGSRSTDEKDAAGLLYVNRLAAELGADAVKTQYTGDADTMRLVVESCPVPLLLLGGPKVDTPQDLIESSTAALSTGARGLVYGRNIWQAENPRARAEELSNLVHNIVPALVGV